MDKFKRLLLSIGVFMLGCVTFVTTIAFIVPRFYLAILEKFTLSGVENASDMALLFSIIGILVSLWCSDFIVKCFKFGDNFQFKKDLKMKEE